MRAYKIGMYLSAAGSPQCLHDELFFKNETMEGTA